jgi:hypothetical protein
MSAMLNSVVDALTEMPPPARLRFAADLVQTVVYDIACQVAPERLEELTCLAALLERMSLNSEPCRYATGAKLSIVR